MPTKHIEYLLGARHGWHNRTHLSGGGGAGLVESAVQDLDTVRRTRRRLRGLVYATGIDGPRGGAGTWSQPLSYKGRTRRSNGAAPTKRTPSPASLMQAMGFEGF